MLNKLKKSILSVMVGGTVMSVSLGVGGCTGMVIDGIASDICEGTGYCLDEDFNFDDLGFDDYQNGNEDPFYHDEDPLYDEPEVFDEGWPGEPDAEPWPI